MCVNASENKLNFFNRIRLIKCSIFSWNRNYWSCVFQRIFPFYLIYQINWHVNFLIYPSYNFIICDIVHDIHSLISDSGTLYNSVFFLINLPSAYQFYKSFQRINFGGQLIFSNILCVLFYWLFPPIFITSFLLLTIGFSLFT